MKQYLAKYWWIFLLRGIFSIIFGVLAFVMPGLTIATLVIIWGAYALVDGVLLPLGLRHGRHKTW